MSGKTAPFFIYLPRFLAFSDFSAYRQHHSVSTSYFGEGIDPDDRQTYSAHAKVAGSNESSQITLS